MLRKCQEILIKKMHSFFLNEQYLPSLVYFLALAYRHLQLEQVNPQLGIILFVFAVAITFISNFNFLFTMAPFLNVNPYLGMVIFMVCLASCNQKWKAYIFIFSIGDSALVQFSHDIFVVTFSIFFCYIIWNDLVFRTISDNVQYFIGFSVIFSYYSIQIIQQNVNQSLNIWLVALILSLSGVFSYSIINKRIEWLKSAWPQQIKSDRLTAHYLNLLQDSLSFSIVKEVKINFHRASCDQNNCFCNNSKTCHNQQYLLRQIYENSIQKFSSTSDNLLKEYYVAFLLKTEQIINCLHFLTKWKPQNYFQFAAHIRAHSQIKLFLQNQNTLNLYEKQYIYALQYDQHFLYVVNQIYKILKLKLIYWQQINKEMPLVSKIQKVGFQIISKMYDLNQVYNKTIKKFEGKLYSFSSTVLYSMYMISTTNYKQYAEIIIKNTAKQIQQSYLFENNASETFAIRARVENQDKCYCQKKNDGFRYNQTEPTKSQLLLKNSQSGKYKLVIDAVSSGFCKLLHLEKVQLLGQELNTIIPDGYKQVHNVRLSYLLNFENQSLTEIVPSKVMHKQLKLPIKGINKELFTGFVCIKFQIDIEMGLTFISIIKRVQSKGRVLLMDFDGNITEQQEHFPNSILQHSQIKRYLEELRNCWLTSKTIKQEKFSLIINSTNVGVTISSPLLGIFLEKENLKQKCPPIHIEVVNQDSNRVRLLQNDDHLGKQIKNMENALVNYEGESTASSTKGGPSAVNIISIFSQSNSVQLYRYLQISFLITILICISANIGTYYAVELPWDPTLPHSNPLNDTINMYTIYLYTTKSLLISQDQSNYIANINSYNLTKIALYYGVTNYLASNTETIINLKTNFKNTLYNCLRNNSAFLRPSLGNRFQSQLNISNVLGSQFSDQKYLQLTYLELMMIYFTDFNLISQLDLKDTILKNTYSNQISQWQNSSFLLPQINNSIDKSQTNATIIIFSLMSFIFISVFPMVYFFRSRLTLHEKLFDLLASIDSQQVCCQIQSLQYIGNIVKNYKDSNEIMKNNVMGYQANILNPKSSHQKRHSADNQIILGLEKYDQKYTEEMEKEQKKENIRSNAKSLTKNSHSKKISSYSSSLSKKNKRSMISSVKKQLMPKIKEEKQLAKRKRAGELDVQGSMLDPNMKINPKHWFFYLSFLSFTILLGLSVHFNQRFNSNYSNNKDLIIKILDDQILLETNLIKAKMFFFITPNSNIKQADEMAVLYPIIQNLPIYSSADNQLNNDAIYTNCVKEVNGSLMIVQKYCQYDYSYNILMGQFAALFKEISELYYQNYANKANSAVLINIQERIYYLQSLNNQIESIIFSKVEILYSNILELSLSYSATKQMMLIVSILWGSICIIIGFLIVLDMKSNYFKEIYMITFLNNDMILKNKRVESFLESIAKNSYS